MQNKRRLQTARENSRYTQEVFVETLDVRGILSKNQKRCLWLIVPYERNFFRTDGLFRESSHVLCVDTTQADETHIEKCRRGMQGSERRMESRHILPAISSSSDTLAVS